MKLKLDNQEPSWYDDERMKIFVSKVSTKNNNWSPFNVGLIAEDKDGKKIKQLFTGFRVGFGSIWAPSVKNKDKYLQTSWCNRDVAEEIYEALRNQMPEVFNTLKDKETAIANLLLTDEICKQRGLN